MMLFSISLKLFFHICQTDSVDIPFNSHLFPQELQVFLEGARVRRSRTEISVSVVQAHVI